MARSVTIPWLTSRPSNGTVDDTWRLVIENQIGGEDLWLRQRIVVSPCSLSFSVLNNSPVFTEYSYRSPFDTYALKKDECAAPKG
jgi:hypothetical protein